MSRPTDHRHVDLWRGNPERVTTVGKIVEACDAARGGASTPHATARLRGAER